MPQLTPEQAASLARTEAAWEAVKATRAKLTPEELTQIEQENEWLYRRAEVELGPGSVNTDWQAWLEEEEAREERE
jgi:hypothetical protein